MQGQIFISYRRATDAWAVEQLRKELVGAFGEKNVFLDKQTIAAGEDWNQQIDQAIREAAAVVVVFSKAWYGEVDLPGLPTGVGVAAQPGQGEASVTVAAPPHTPGRRRIDDPADKLRIELELADRIVSLAQDGFDVAIRHSNAVPETHVAWALCETRALLVATRAYLRKHGTPVAPEDLAQHSCLRYLRSGGGIVIDSEPEAERLETLAKARLLVSTLVVSTCPMVTSHIWLASRTLRNVGK